MEDIIKKVMVTAMAEDITNKYIRRSKYTYDKNIGVFLKEDYEY